MHLHMTGFNGAEDAVAGPFQKPWSEVEAVLRAMALHLKASDQAGIQGDPIFDPKGSNEYIKQALAKKRWEGGIRIPEEYSFLGTDVDFAKDGLLVEVQLSTYAFLLNNLLRSELFYKARLPFGGAPVGLLVLITKARMFPASNSTLYYEQAVKQVSALAKHEVFKIPMLVVGLAEVPGIVQVVWTEWGDARYSRDVASRHERRCEIAPGRSAASRHHLRLL